MDHAVIFNVFPLQAKRPGGAYRIATVLREHDWDVEVVDWAAEWQLDELKELAKSRIASNTVFIGFSCFFSHWTPTLSMFTSWLKMNYPRVPLVIGGQSRPRMDAEHVDYFVTGYGETAILELVKKFKGDPFSMIRYDSRFKDKRVVTANHSYPAYPLKSLIIKYENRDFIESHEWLTVEFSRGCIFKCLYCNFPILGVKGDHTRDADDYVRQLQETYDNWGVTKYVTADETFNDYTEKIIKFADATDRLSFRPYISAFIRADLLVSRPQDWEHLKRLGMWAQFYGIESFNHESAKSIGKGMPVEKLQEGLITAKNYFKKDNGPYRGHISLIAGLPHETKETLNATIEWCENNWQGECAEIYPLEIPMNDTYDVPSVLTSKWQEYGYRKISDQPSVVSNAAMTGAEEFMAHGIYNLNWKTDHLTFDQCRQLSLEFNIRLRSASQRIGTFSLQEFPFPIEDVLEINYRTLHNGKNALWYYDTAKTMLDNKIKTYIYKKLSI